MATAPNRAENATPGSSSPQAEPAAALAGPDRAAFSEELYAALAPLINKLLWTLLGPDAERDDLAHEIFLRILQNAHQLRDRSRLQAWAARLAINAVKNEFRRRKLRRWLSLSADDEQTPSYHPDFEGREVLLHTYAVLAKLPERERLPLTLHLVGQQSVEEIALATDCSTRTIKRRLRAARPRFVRLALSDPLLAERLAQSRLAEDDDD
jgi:RNA polymerase sigma-70 factor, ECF subfamily